MIGIQKSFKVTLPLYTEVRLQVVYKIRKKDIYRARIKPRSPGLQRPRRSPIESDSLQIGSGSRSKEEKDGLHSSGEPSGSAEELGASTTIGLLTSSSSSTRTSSSTVCSSRTVAEVLSATPGSAAVNRK